MICENCNNEHDGKYGSGRFCSTKCSRGFATKHKRKEINDKVSSSMIGRKLSPDHIKNIEAGNNFNRKEKIIKNCMCCGIEIVSSPSQIKKKFCSTKCWVKYTEEHKSAFLLYRQRCNFDFNVNDYPEKFNTALVENIGWYSPANKGNNLNGVSKDHMLSVREGFELGIDPQVIKHPANCELMPHRHNQKKKNKSSITLEELLKRISNW
jgi:hypothetical protein